LGPGEELAQELDVEALVWALDSEVLATVLVTVLVLVASAAALVVLGCHNRWCLHTL